MNTSHNFTTNPYIFGTPIYKKEQLYGREETTIKQIKNHFKADIQITLLHVQRRIGKTSLITCLPQYFTEEQNDFKFVTFSFQSYKDKSRTEILDHLADDIAGTIYKLPKEVRALADNPYNFFQLFLPRIINEYLSGKKLVLLLDEFDVLGEDSTISTPGEYLFDWLEQVVKQEKKLFAILVFGRPVQDMTYLKNFLKKQTPIEVGLLDKESTQNLIVEPARGKLEYESDAINAIWQLSAGHPSLTQLLCFYIFKNCREQGIKKVVHTNVESHVELILDEAMEGGGAVLNGFLDALNNPEKLFFRVVAASQNEVGENRLKTYIKNWHFVGKRLVKEYSFLEEKKDGTGYKIKVELVRLWLVKKYPLSDEEKLQMGKIPEKNQNLPEINNNHKTPVPEQNDNPQGPNQIAKFLSLLMVVSVILAPIMFTVYRIMSSGNSQVVQNDGCDLLWEKIDRYLKDEIDKEERSQVIEKINSEWYREEQSLDEQCPNIDGLDEKYNQLLWKSSLDKIGSQKYEEATKTLCKITNKYGDFSEVENTLEEWIFNNTLSNENKEKVIETLIKQNQSPNDCPAYSFKNEQNENLLSQQKNLLSQQKNLLSQQKNLLSEQKNLQSEQKNLQYDQEAKNHVDNDKNYRYEKAVESYCKITESYASFNNTRKQLEEWFFGENYTVHFTLEDQQIVREKLKELKGQCPASPLK
ncbi:MAG: AAA family ATPase [Okeania sp. SIO3B5]|uniref:AAA family ATPase n=1 Tax=Okeania sp. SIO3B5 TaxID=2607811 RepID=UPI0013FF67ED|nr:AAA family ATPase [Okeania sp. SIO3B5]NEO57808.1 AAA family ATPase [Okeania sp. SIO3B5]